MNHNIRLNGRNQCAAGSFQARLEQLSEPFKGSSVCFKSSGSFSSGNPRFICVVVVLDCWFQALSLLPSTLEQSYTFVLLSVLVLTFFWPVFTFPIVLIKAAATWQQRQQQNKTKKKNIKHKRRQAAMQEELERRIRIPLLCAIERNQ